MKNIEPHNQNYLEEEDTIDIIELLKTIWEGRKLLIISVASFFIVGCIIALLSPVIYTSKTIFVPQISVGENSASKSLGSLAGLVGFNLKTDASSSDSYLSPLLYKKLSESEEFSIELLNETLVSTEGEKITVKKYLMNDAAEVEVASINPVLDAYNFISEEDYKIIINFQSKFSVVLDEKLGFIKVSATDKDAFISSQIVSLVTKKLQSKIIALRTNKIKERLDYSEEQYDLKRNEFEDLQNRVAKFKDANKNISTALFLSRLEKLESEYNLQKNILMGLANEYNQNKIKLNKDTPIFSVIDDVSVPLVRTKPKRTLIVFISVFIGFTLAVGYLLLNTPIIRMIDEFKAEYKNIR